MAELTRSRHIIKKADIRTGHRVLEIGSGWGSFAIEVSSLSLPPIHWTLGV